MRAGWGGQWEEGERGHEEPLEGRVLPFPGCADSFTSEHVSEIVHLHMMSACGL